MRATAWGHSVLLLPGRKVEAGCPRGRAERVGALGVGGRGGPRLEAARCAGPMFGPTPKPGAREPRPQLVHPRQGNTVELPEEENTPEKRVDRIFAMMDKVRPWGSRADRGGGCRAGGQALVPRCWLRQAARPGEVSRGLVGSHPHQAPVLSKFAGQFFFHKPRFSTVSVGATDLSAFWRSLWPSNKCVGSRRKRIILEYSCQHVLRRTGDVVF